MTKPRRPSLFASVVAARDAEPDDDEAAPGVEIEAQTTAAIRKARPPSRQGKRILSIYLKPEAWKQLRMLSVNLERPSQSLGEEALNLLFEKHRLNRIA
jgi:hypothetical protein